MKMPAPILMIIGLFLLVENSYAEELEYYPIPLNKKQFVITRGYDNNSHQKTFTNPDGSVVTTNDEYALDFKSADNQGGCTEIGAPVLAIADGVVEEIKTNKYEGYGNMVLIGHENNRKSRFAHLVDGSILVEDGERVVKNQVIGLMGDTGNTSGIDCSSLGFRKGSHLHLSLYDYSSGKREGFKPEPLGKSLWKNIGKDLKIGGAVKHLHDTLMIDPGNEWETMRDKKNAPYQLWPDQFTANGKLVSPKKASFGVPTVFRFEGNDLDLANAFYIERCENAENVTSKEEKISGKAIEIRCTPKAQSNLSKQYEYDDQLRYILKYAPSAVSILEGDIPATSTKGVQLLEITPMHPIYDVPTTFIVSGINLHSDLKITAEDCLNLAKEKEISSEYMLTFKCTPKLTAGLQPENHLTWYEDHPLTFDIGGETISAVPLNGDFADHYYEEKPNDTANQSHISITKVNQQQRVYTISFPKQYPLFANISIEQCSPLERMLSTDKSYRCYMAVTDHIDVEVRKAFSGALIETFSYPIREVFQYEVKEYKPGNSTAVLELQGVGLPKKPLQINGGPCTNELTQLKYGTSTVQGFSCDLSSAYHPETVDIPLQVTDETGILLFDGFERQMERDPYLP